MRISTYYYTPFLIPTLMVVIILTLVGVKEGDIISSIKIVKGQDKFLPGKGTFSLPTIPSVTISTAEIVQ